MSEQTGIIGVLRKSLNDELAEEGVTQDLIDYVMLEVAYSPVLPCRGMRLEDAHEAVPWGFYPEDVLPEKFEVKGWIHNPVDRESLKIMRLRYLLAEKERQRPWVEALIGRMNSKPEPGATP